MGALSVITASLFESKHDFAAGASTAPPSLPGRLEARHRHSARLAELEALEAGWDGEDAQALDADALRVAFGVLERSLQAGLPEAEVFAVPDGGVQLEWRAGPLELELEIEPGARRMIFVCDDDASDQRIDGELPTDVSRFALALARLNAYSVER